MTTTVERRRLAAGSRTLSYLAAGMMPSDRIAVFLHAFPLNAEMRSKLVGTTSRDTRPDVLTAIDRMMAQATAPGVGWAISRILNRPDSTADLAAFNGPVTVVVGEEDVLTPPADAASMSAAVLGAVLVTIPRAGHLSNLESPDAFNAAMHDWLGSHHGP